MEFIESMVMSPSTREPGKAGAAAADLITKLIGVNALTDAETRNVLSLFRSAYQGRFRPAPSRIPATILLLQHLASETDQESLKQEISETMAFVQAQ